MRDDLNVEFVVFRSIGARITGSGLPSKGLTVYPSRLVGFPRNVDSENRDETLGLRTVFENSVRERCILLENDPTIHKATSRGHHEQERLTSASK